MAEPVPFNPDCPSCVSLARQLAELTILVKQLQATVEKQGKELARLKAKSKPTSRNSSTPPSADPNRKRASKGPSSRKQGGQPGHKGHNSKPLPPDEVFAVKPDACEGCGSALTGDDPAPYRHHHRSASS